MSIVQSEFGSGRRIASEPRAAGTLHVQRFVFDFTGQALAAGDILEIGYLPAGYTRIADATLITEGTGFVAATTVDVGFMTGVQGDALDATRTSGAEIFAAADATARFLRMVKADSVLAEPSEQARGIGLKFSAAVAAAATKKVSLILYYHQ